MGYCSLRGQADVQEAAALLGFGVHTRNAGVESGNCNPRAFLGFFFPRHSSLRHPLPWSATNFPSRVHGCGGESKHRKRRTSTPGGDAHLLHQLRGELHCVFGFRSESFFCTPCSHTPKVIAIMGEDTYAHVEDGQVPVVNTSLPQETNEMSLTIWQTIKAEQSDCLVGSHGLWSHVLRF